MGHRQVLDYARRDWLLQRDGKSYFIVKGYRSHPVTNGAYQRLRDMDLLLPVTGEEGMWRIIKEAS